MKRLVLNFGFVLGICAGVLAFFLFFYFANVHDNIEPHRAEAFKNSSDDETTSSEVDLVLKLQERMGFGHEALSVLDRFNKTDFRTINNLISSVEQFEDSSPSKTVNRLIIGELVHMNPKATLDLADYLGPADREDFLQTVFTEWSETDLTAALQATEQLISPLWEIAIRTILNTQSDQHDQVKKYAAERGLDRQVGELISESKILNLLAQEPGEAWRVLIENKLPDKVQENLLYEVLSAWIYHDGYQVLDQVFETRHQIDPFQLENVLAKVVRHQPQNFFHQTTRYSRDKRDWLLPIVVEAWSKSDPLASFNALNTIDAFDGAMLRTTIIRDWAGSDPSTLLGRLEFFPRNQRNTAASFAISEITYQNPNTAQELLSNWVEIPGVDADDLERIFVRDWAAQSPVKALLWVQENVPNGGTQYAYLLDSVLSYIVIEDPEQALQVALAEPDNSSYTQLFFGDLIQSMGTYGHIDQVISVLDQIPENESAQISTFSTLARHLVRGDRWEDAVQLAIKVPDEARSWYYERLAYHGIRTNVDELIDRLEALPSNEIRSIIVKEILNRHEFEGNIVSDEQITYLRSLVGDS